MFVLYADNSRVKECLSNINFSNDGIFLHEAANDKTS